MRPSEFLAPSRGTDLPSPATLSKLAVPLEKRELGVMGAVFDFRGDVIAPVSGLAGRLLVETSKPRGGCGKELILIVFRTPLVAELTPEAMRGCGSAPTGAGVVGGP
jgi:hypothetical protein